MAVRIVLAWVRQVTCEKPPRLAFSVASEAFRATPIDAVAAATVTVQHAVEAAAARPTLISTHATEYF